MIATFKNLFINSFDWHYIFSFIIIGFAFNHYKVREGIVKNTKLKIGTRFRVAIVGVLYGVLIYYLRDYEKKDIEILLRSFLFAFVFHKLIIDAFLCYLYRKKILPENIARHFINCKVIRYLENGQL